MTQILHIKVGEPVEASLARARQTMEALQRGQTPDAYFGIGFADLPQLLATFTPRRWDLLKFLSEHGSMTVADLTRALGRNYKNVHNDITALSAWMAVKRGPDGRVSVPWQQLDLSLPLQHRAA